MAEGDTIHRNARRLVEALRADALDRVEAPSLASPLRRQAVRMRELEGRRLERAEARGKHLLLRFEGDLALHCHQGMRGSWHFYRRGESWRKPRGAAWVALATAHAEAVEFNGTQMALRTGGELRADPRLRALGPDLLADGFTSAAGVAALRTRTAPEVELGEALLDQNVIAGIGNIFKSEGCFAARLDPWRRLGELDDSELAGVVEATTALMRAAVAGGRAPRHVYRRAGQPCRRCRTPIHSRGQGDANRTTYWCSRCQGPAGRDRPRDRFAGASTEEEKA